MNVSPVGILVTTSLLLLGLYLRGPVVIGLIASLAFGSTAIVTLGSLGGSSPLIYTCFVAILLLSIVFRTKVPRDIGIIFARSAAAWIVATIVSYAVVGSFILPRLFAGQTSAFVPSRLRGGVLEVPLEPVSGNITQTGYLVLGAATFLAIAILLVRNDSTEALRRGFFAWCILHATMGVIDLATKIVGAGDVLEPIRTASYVMLTQAEEAGFFRIAGAYSEASAFGGVTLACLAFTLTYWRRTKSLPALSLATLLLVLLMLSTSSTAYVGAMLLSIPLACSVGRSILVGQLTSEDLLLIVLSVLCIVGVMAIYLHTPEFFEPIIHLFETTVINKPLSASGQERAYWNYKSLQSFLDTGGLGIGLGSSRASSWLIAVLSQLGVAGIVLLGSLVVILLRGLGYARSCVEPDVDALVSSVRACALAGVVSGSLASGTADPGIVFFISVAVVSIYRGRARAGAGARPVPPRQALAGC